MKNIKFSVLALLIGSILIVGLSAANYYDDYYQTIYHTWMKGSKEVPPTASEAGGYVRMRRPSTGAGLDFKVEVDHSSGVTAVHIHCAPAGANGPVGVTLYEGNGQKKNLAIAGSFVGPDAGNGCGWLDRSDVVNAILSGNAYINVHTLDHPSGEIRGQLKVHED